MNPVCGYNLTCCQSLQTGGGTVKTEQDNYNRFIIR